MAYVLYALIARREVFAQTPPWIADSAIIPLEQGFAMLPLTSALRGQFGEPERPWVYPVDPDFLMLPQALVPHLRELSRRGRVAYVEAEFHGGVGDQLSMVWEDGEPLGEREESSFAINDALRRLGVEAAEGRDRFDTLGLGRHRDVDDWIASLRPPAPPLPPSPEPAPPPLPGRKPWWRFWA